MSLKIASLFCTTCGRTSEFVYRSGGIGSESVGRAVCRVHDAESPECNLMAGRMKVEDAPESFQSGIWPARFHQGRLLPGHFNRMDVSGPAGGHVDLHLVRHDKDVTWFSVDTTLRRAFAVNFRDVYTNTVLALREYLRGDEAVLLVSQTDWMRLQEAHPELSTGQINDSAFDLSLAEVANVAYALVTADRIATVDAGSPRDPHPLVEKIPNRAVFLALLA